jgi:hypothetical protein
MDRPDNSGFIENRRLFFQLIGTALNRDTYNSLETGWVNFATIIVVLFFSCSLYVVAMANYKGPI